MSVGTLIFRIQILTKSNQYEIVGVGSSVLENEGELTMQSKDKVNVIKRVHRTDPKIEARLKTLAHRYGRKKLQGWFYDDPPPFVMSLAAYVRMCGTWVGYRAFVREDEAQEFVYGLRCLPGWLDRRPAY